MPHIARGIRPTRPSAIRTAPCSRRSCAKGTYSATLISTRHGSPDSSPVLVGPADVQVLFAQLGHGLQQLVGRVHVRYARDAAQDAGAPHLVAVGVRRAPFGRGVDDEADHSGFYQLDSVGVPLPYLRDRYRALYAPD